MLTRELMGLIALAILWVNVGLMLAVAGKQLGRLERLRRRLLAARARGDLVSGRTVGDGPIAVRSLAQVGRAVTSGGPRRIRFTTTLGPARLLGGALRTADGEVLTLSPREAGLDLWIDHATVARALAPTDAREFARVYAEADRSRGHTRQAEVKLSPGASIHVYGERTGEGVGPDPEGRLLLSTVEPVAWCRRRESLCRTFLLGAFLATSATTALAFWPPLFGPMSTAGGALGLLLFLGLQPVGTALGDAVTPPSRRAPELVWREPAAHPKPASPPAF